MITRRDTALLLDQDDLVLPCPSYSSAGKNVIDDDHCAAFQFGRLVREDDAGVAAADGCAAVTLERLPVPGNGPVELHQASVGDDPHPYKYSPMRLMRGVGA